MCLHFIKFFPISDFWICKEILINHAGCFSQLHPEMSARGRRPFLRSSALPQGFRNPLVRERSYGASYGRPCPLKDILCRHCFGLSFPQIIQPALGLLHQKVQALLFGRYVQFLWVQFHDFSFAFFRIHGASIWKIKCFNLGLEYCNEIWPKNQKVYSIFLCQ